MQQSPMTAPKGLDRHIRPPVSGPPLFDETHLASLRFSTALDATFLLISRKTTTR